MAVTLQNGAVTSGTPTAWVAIPEARIYSIQSSGVNGVVQFSNDGVNLAVVPAPGNGGPSVVSTASGTDQLTVVGSTNPTPFAFARFIPIASGTARVTLTSVI